MAGLLECAAEGRFPNDAASGEVTPQDDGYDPSRSDFRRVGALSPVADAEVASGSGGTNFGTSTNIFIQGTTATGTFGIERGWLKFDLSGIPAGSTISSAMFPLKPRMSCSSLGSLDPAYTDR